MNELYWITTLGGINTAGTVFFVLLSIALVLCIFVWLGSQSEDEKETKNTASIIIRRIMFPFILSLLITIFVPSTKQMYLIYGLGTTIDYVKSNDKAKRLPDKAIEALTRYLDSIKKEKK